MSMDNFSKLFDHICIIEPIILKSTINNQQNSTLTNNHQSQLNDQTPLVTQPNYRKQIDTNNHKNSSIRMKLIGIFIIVSIIIAIIIAFILYFFNS